MAENKKADKKKADKNEAKKKKNGRPNNLLLALLIFGSIALIFGGVYLYNYMQKPASIQAYIKTLGGTEAFSNIQLTETSTANITAKKNKLSIVINDNNEDTKTQTEYYTGSDGKKQLKYVSAYYLYTLKSQTRGFKASVTTVVNVKDTKVTTIKLTYREAKKLLKEEGAIE